MITGGCLCGALRYEAGGEPLFALLCHCDRCRRVSGTGHLPVMGVAKSRFKATGATTDYSGEGGSGRATVQSHCAACGSLVFGSTEIDLDSIVVFAGSLDDPSVFKPQFVQFIGNRPEWDRVDTGLREFREGFTKEPG